MYAKTATPKHDWTWTFAIIAIFFAFFTLTFTGCKYESTLPESPKSEASVQTEKPAASASVNLAWGAKPDWTKALIESVEKSGLAGSHPKDIKSFCANYSHLDHAKRVEFWAQLVSSMAKWESNFKPETFMAECRKNKCVYNGGCTYHSGLGYCMKGGHKLDEGVVISRGLLQISLQSAQGYSCEVSVPNDLHNAAKNLDCGVKILARFVPRDSAIAGKSGSTWQGGARYWAVLRGTSDYTKKALSGIQAYTRGLNMCKGG